MYLDNIPMSGRTRRCLRRLGCRTLGKITFKEINKILEENGFSSKYI